jgi:hypothetical protein
MKIFDGARTECQWEACVEIGVLQLEGGGHSEISNSEGGAKFVLDITS